MPRQPSKILNVKEAKTLDLEQQIATQQKVVDKETKVLEKLKEKHGKASRTRQHNAGSGDAGDE